MQDEIDEYIAVRKAEGLAEESLKHYGLRLGRLLEFLLDRDVKRWQDVRSEHVDQYLLHLRKAGLSYSSREAFTVIARCFLKWLHERGKTLGNAARHIDLPRCDKEDLPLLEPPLSEAEVDELLASLPRRNATDLRNIVVIELLFSAGLRRGEALALRVKDADLANKIVYVRHGKGGKPRDIPMMRGLCGALRDYLALRRSLLRGPDHGALLLVNGGKRMSKGSLDQFFTRLNRQRGPDKPHLHAHLFRHSIAVALLRGGADLRYVQMFLGHDCIESTRNYLRLVPSDLRKAYDDAMPIIQITA